MRRALLLLSAFWLAACVDGTVNANPATPAPASVTPTQSETPDTYAAFEDVLAQHQRMSARVARISRRLRVANVSLCAQTRMDAGLISHSLTDYPPELRELALHFMDLGEDGRFVRAVIPGSPADRARVRKGDRIVGGWPISGARPLVLDGGEGSFPVDIEAEAACDVPTHVVNSPMPNAGTDGREIDLSTALIEQAGDDSALAFIIAHEMAHVLRGHSPDGPRWAAELEADADALVLMRNAGFDVDGTVAGWEAGVEAHRDTQALSATHPPLEIRLRNLKKAMARLAGREGKVLGLEPN